MKKQRSEEWRGYRTAGIRLSEEYAPELRSVRTDTESARDDVLEGYHLFDKAHLVMLAEGALIPIQDAVAMLKALREMEHEGVPETRRRVGGGMHSGEMYLIRRLGEEVGGREHLARSSGDLGAVATRTTERDRLLSLMAKINECRGALLKVAEQHVETIMPGYFHFQHAQPVTFAHHLVTWLAPLERSFERCAQAYARVNQSPAGGVILTGSDFPIDRRRTAELMGFDRPQMNTMDSIQSSDLLLDAIVATVILLSDVGRFAEDLALWDGNEYDVVEPADRYASASSILINMKTSTPPMYIRGGAGAGAAALVSALLNAKGPTGDISPARSEVTGLAWSAMETAEHYLTMIASMMDGGITVKADKMLERARSYFATATDLAGALVRERNLPWRTAHQIIGILMRYCEEQGLRPDQVTPEMVDAAAMEYMDEPAGLTQEQITTALDPVRFINDRTLLGGPAPSEARRQLGELGAALERDRGALAAMRQRRDAGLEKLEQAIDALERRQN